LIIISGSGTFTNRELIKSFGGMWNGIDRNWTLPDFTPADRLNKLRALPGVIIKMPDGNLLMGVQPPPFRLDFDKLKTPQGVVVGESEPSPRDGIMARIIGDMLAAQEIGRNREYGDIRETAAIHGNDETWLGQFDKRPSAFFGFASFADMLDFVDVTPDAIKSERGRNDGWLTNDPEWAGSANMTHALKLARDGWRDGVAKAKLAAEIIGGDHAQARQRVHGVAGGRVNVGRMLSGSPVHMVHRPRRDGVKVITLLIDVWMASAIAADDAVIRAACVAAMCDVLENSGYSCEIVAVGSAYTGGLRMQVATNIKQAGDALNLEDVTFALGHPSMLRRLCFALAANEPRLRQFWRNMGMQEAAFVDTDPGAFYINKLSGNLGTGSFTDKVRRAFARIVPDEFPINLSEAS
jgi:hypothetical protein